MELSGQEDAGHGDGHAADLQVRERLIFRSLCVSRLAAADISWRLAFTRPSLSAPWAAADAGLGVAVRTAVGMPRTLSVLDETAHGLPDLPMTALTLHRAEAEPSPVIARLASILRETVREAVRPSPVRALADDYSAAS